MFYKKISLFLLFLFLSFVLIKLFLNFYHKKNMEIIEQDEKDIIEQELRIIDDLNLNEEIIKYLNDAEPNILSEEEKDLGQVTQKPPQI